VAVKDHFHAAVASEPAAEAAVASLVSHGRLVEGVKDSHRNGDPERSHYRAGTTVKVGKASRPGTVEVLITTLPQREQEGGNITNVEVSLKVSDQRAGGASHEEVIEAARRDLAIEKQRLGAALGVTTPEVQGTAREVVEA